MKTLPIYQVDAFSNDVFGGNPAAVMPLEEWLPDDTMQKLALENNLSETAFLVALPDDTEEDFHIRWFTPGIEVPLCGHATLASAWVLFNKLGWEKNQILLQSKSGPLGVKQTDDGWLELDFPNLAFEECPTPNLILDALDGVSGVEEGEADEKCLVTSESMTLEFEKVWLTEKMQSAALE